VYTVVKLADLFHSYYHFLVLQNEIADLWPYSCSNVYSNGCHGDLMNKCADLSHGKIQYLLCQFFCGWILYQNQVSPLTEWC
jgi:hypothetical protein